MVDKAMDLDIDMVMFDLEDAVAADAKAGARTELCATLADRRPKAGVSAVRMNAWTSPWSVLDIEALAALPDNALDVLVLPKTESIEQVSELERVVLEFGMTHVKFDLQIESPASLVRVEALASSASRVAALVFGPADFSAAMGMPQLTGGALGGALLLDPLVYAKSRIAVAAKAESRLAIDGPFLDLGDTDGLARSAAIAAQLGFDGKWAIHPSQIETIVAAFTPSAALVDRARALLHAYEAATSAGTGAVRFEGEMIDDASRKMALSVLARSRR